LDVKYNVFHLLCHLNVAVFTQEAAPVTQSSYVCKMSAKDLII